MFDARHFFFGDFSGANIQTTINLPRIRGDYFSAFITADLFSRNPFGDLYGQVALAHGRRSENHEEWAFLRFRHNIFWCREGESNSHGLLRTILSRVRLPIPPSRHTRTSLPEFPLKSNTKNAALSLSKGGVVNCQDDLPVRVRASVGQEPGRPRRSEERRVGKE